MGNRRRSLGATEEVEDMEQEENVDADVEAAVLHAIVTASRSRRAACATPPCDSCSVTRELGDTNGDCVFDINDVLFVQNFLVAAVFDSNLINTFKSYQRSNMVADLNGGCEPVGCLLLPCAC